MLLAVAFPTIVFGLADYTWFLRDDWMFITERRMDLESLLEPHNAHWTTVPVVVFRALYAAFGVRTYVPYLAVVVALHLMVVALLRTIMVRAGVGRWPANAFAGAFVFFGPGREGIVWAFQIGFTGSVAFVLLQLVLADHDGPADRRDAVGLVAGLLGVMSASPSLVVVAAMGPALLVRRGVRRATIHVAPLAVAYALYTVAAEPANGASPGFDVGVAVDWLRNGLSADFLAIGQHRAVVAALVVLLVAGLAVHLLAPGAAAPRRWQERVQQVAVPVALFLAMGLFIVLVARSRAYLGPVGARARRYVYFYGVCTLPLLAVATTALARRWRALAPLALLVVVAVPANIASFDQEPFGPNYHRAHRSVLTAVVAVPEARVVDGELQPFADPFMGPGVTLDFLLHAEATGRLPDPPDPIPPTLRNELLVRLSLRQLDPGLLVFCEPVEGPELRIAPAEGEVLGISGPVTIQLVEAGAPLVPRVRFLPGDGSALVGTGLGRELLIRPPEGSAELAVCRVPGP